MGDGTRGSALPGERRNIPLIWLCVIKPLFLPVTNRLWITLCSLLSSSFSTAWGGLWIPQSLIVLSPISACPAFGNGKSPPFPPPDTCWSSATWESPPEIGLAASSVDRWPLTAGQSDRFLPGVAVAFGRGSALQVIDFNCSASFSAHLVRLPLPTQF